MHPSPPLPLIARPCLLLGIDDASSGHARLCVDVAPEAGQRGVPERLALAAELLYALNVGAGKPGRPSAHEATNHAALGRLGIDRQLGQLHDLLEGESAVF